jgi:hypothetical protein
MKQVQSEIGRFNGKIIQRNGRNNLLTTEGVSAWHEGLQALKDQASINSLEWDDGLALAARDHCNDIGPKGLV